MTYDAKQAREAAYEVKLKIINEQFQEIIQKIKGAAEEGFRGIYINLATYKENIEELKKREFILQDCGKDGWWVGW
ncbi:MAG: hypothetical protein VKK42_21815 [Lyngbya sp.]|nr:hypothetical protein [Lyngbya sp.]